MERAKSWALRNYIADALYYQPQGLMQATRFSDLAKPKKFRPVEDIVDDILAGWE